jgi:predicted DNA-binding transcriptional regulator AlpA
MTSLVKRTKDACVYIGLSRSSFLKLVALGYIPTGIKLTPTGRAVGWRTVDLDAYIASRLKESL